MDMDALRASLVQESRDLLGEMDRVLLEIEKGGATPERIHAVFRVAHTIKGSVGLFGLDHIVSFTHAMETLLDEVRAERLACTPELVSLLISCGDHLQILVDGIEADRPAEDLQPEVRRDLLARLTAAGKSPAPIVPRSPTPVAIAEPAESVVEILEGGSGEAIGSDAWHISLRPSPDLLRDGVDPLALLRYLSTMGRVAHVEAVYDDLPDLADLDPTRAHLGLEIRFETDADRARILSAFEFVSEGSLLRLVPPHAKIEAYLRLLEALPEEPARLGELLVSCQALTAEELAAALRLQSEGGASHPPLGRILVGEQVVPPVLVAAALEKQKSRTAEHGTSRDSRVVKVEVGKLDRLIDLVGELVIAASAARLATRSEGARASEEAVANLAQLVEDIRDSSLGLRMVPIGEVFNRFPRVVRDLGKELGKEVAVEITGAETELDKSMVDRLADPLTHIVRNAMDHGIEARETRLAAGKPAEGVLRFHAFHETGSIVLEVSDDGGGIRRSKVLARARERGLVDPGQELSDREILRLVFAPGFSTAEAVTNLSGRGVGMDVVKRTIEGLRGEIELESEEGRGSTVRMRMPLTLAIIDGFLVGVGDRSYVVPLDMVVECADLPPASGPAARSGTLANLRGEPLPLVDLRKVFSLSGQEPQRRNIVVVEHGGRRAGLVVDQLQGEFQTVIKPLSGLFSGVRGIGGSTILGSGEVALILDIPALVRKMERDDARSVPSDSRTSHPIEGAHP